MLYGRPSGENPAGKQIAGTPARSIGNLWGGVGLGSKCYLDRPSRARTHVRRGSTRATPTRIGQKGTLPTPGLSQNCLIRAVYFTRRAGYFAFVLPLRYSLYTLPTAPALWFALERFHVPQCVSFCKGLCRECHRHRPVALREQFGGF
jgi:hypothetical protein